MFLSNSEVEDLLSNYDSAGHYLSKWGSELVRGPSSRITDVDRPIDRTRDFEIIQVNIIEIFTNALEKISSYKKNVTANY
jgi:hypothetical protein